ncbi:hypothetical protein D9M71_629640 [compost metagenome]
MHHLHARDAHQPALRRLALVADAAELLVALLRMAGHAGFAQDLRARTLGRQRRLRQAGDRHGQAPGPQVVAESCHHRNRLSTLFF